MIKYTFILKDKNGLHARPAGKLCALCKSLDSEIRVKTPTKEADGKRLLSLMSLGARHGTEIVIEIEGGDEEKSERAIIKHVKEELNAEI